MTIYEWADLLGMDSKKSRGPEDFWARCPCHGDTEPSLHVRVGPETGEVSMICFSCSATGVDVCKALKLPISEVMCDAMTGERRGGAAAKPPPKVKKREGPKRSYPYRVGGKLGAYAITAVYEFRDREGRVVLRKARGEMIDEAGKRKKTFAMQSIGADGNWYSTEGIYGNLLYHLPDVLSAAAQGGRILIVEGEKDADNLRKVGVLATCGLHGAAKTEDGKGDLSGKWCDDHTSALDGAGEVIVIPDHDAAGESLGQWICKAVKNRGKVGTVRLMRIADHYPDLPHKGDFTDWVGQLKERGVDKKSDVIAALNTMIDATPVWDVKNIRKFADGKPEKKESKSKTASAGGFDGDGSGGGEEYPSYHGSGLYCIKAGRLAMRTGRDGDAKCLCDFLPEPKEIVFRDDGSGVRMEFVIAATDPAGNALPDAVVRGTDKYQAMRWPLDAWGHWGNIKPIKNAAQHVLDAINTAGQTVSRHREVYEHMGWRKIDGEWAYLYHGGAIGADNVAVEMMPDLTRYTLDGPQVDLFEAGCSELMLLDAFPARVVYPQLAQAYLAPVYSVMEEMQQPPSYAVMVVGKSNAGKSTVASYVLAHFGNFYNREFPAAFENTANGVRDKLFYCKDALLVVDDYVPPTDGRVKNPHDMVANTIISAVADRSGRARLDADKRLTGSKPCRCMCIMTGEQLPQITTSRELRIYKIDVVPGELYRDVTELEPYRQMARRGHFRAVMRAYIEGLRGRYDDLGEEIEARIEAAGALVHGALHRKEGRLIECATHMMVGVGLMLDHLETLGVMTPEDRARRLGEAAAAIASNLDEQGRQADERKPEEVWLETLRSLLATRSVTLMPIDDAISEGFRAGMIGYKLEEEYWLVPEAADEYIAERLRKGGKSLGASRQAILRALVQSGKVIPEPRRGSEMGNPTSSMRVGKKKARVIRIPRWVIDDPDNPPDPEKMGFTPMEGEQVPFEV